MKTRRDYWIEIIDNMTLEELIELNNRAKHIIWAGSGADSDILFQIFKRRFLHFNKKIEEFDTQRNTEIARHNKIKEQGLMGNNKRAIDA